VLSQNNSTYIATFLRVFDPSIVLLHLVYYPEPLVKLKTNLALLNFQSTVLAKLHLANDCWIAAAAGTDKFNARPYRVANSNPLLNLVASGQEKRKLSR
jgi:hypothetical protein